MSAPVSTPDEGTLREFLLGTLPPERAEPIASWLSSDPSAADSLRRLAASDLLTTVLADTTAVEPVPIPAVERISRSVSRALATANPPLPAAPETLPRFGSPEPGIPTTPMPAEREGSALSPAVTRTPDQGTRPDAPAPPSGTPSFVFLRPAQAPDELGRLAGFRILEVLGKGGMGLVFRAEDPQLHRQVALKVIKPDHSADPQYRERFLREARAAAQLQSDHVMPVHQTGEDNGVLFLAMPLLRGEPLETRLSRGRPLTIAEQLRIGHEMALGLAAAHARGLIHRDVKPSNVWLESNPAPPRTPAPPSRPFPTEGVTERQFLDSQDREGEEAGRVKILDFGLVLPTDGAEPLTHTGVSLGTPGFMSPEQADGLPLDARSDLFSLGVVLYLMATGRQPFKRDSVSATLRAVVDHHPALPHEVAPEVPPPLSALIVRLLAKSPDDRPQSAGRTADALRAIALGGVTAAEPLPTRPARARRRRTAVAVGAAVLALLAGLGGWILTHLPKPQVVQGPAPNDPPRPSANDSSRIAPVFYRGRVDILVEREDPGGAVRRLRLNEPGALPLRKTDKFQVEGRVDPPSYLYVVWVDPGHDVTPVYPWDPTLRDQHQLWASRPAKEEPVGRVKLPRNVEKPWYNAPEAKPGVATMVLFARPTPLDVPDEAVRGWFEGLPDLPLPPDGEHAAVWFDDYVEVKDADRPRTFGVAGSDDPFARWQGQLRKVLGDRAAFQTAVSFARTGGKRGEP